MTTEIFSNHIGGASELTILADIKPGYVPCRGLITYSARLRRHLRLLGALRRVGLEGRRAGVYTGPIDALRTLQYVRWTLLDDDTRMLLAVNFDRPLQPYVRRIVDIAGPLLDTILCHCEGFEGKSSDQGFDQFMDFATRHQVPVDLFAAASPNMTVDDADYLQQAEKLLRSAHFANKVSDIAKKAGKLRVESVEEKFQHTIKHDKLALLDQALNILQALYDNAHLFPDKDFRTHESRDDLLYYRLAERLAPVFWEGLYASLSENQSVNGSPAFLNITRPLTTAGIQTINHLIEAGIAHAGGSDDALALLDRYRDVRNWFANPPTARLATIPTPPTNVVIQPGLREKPTTLPNVACQLLFRIDASQGGRDFLAVMASKIWSDTDDGVIRNLSITHPGLKAIKVDEKLRARFPDAFREGMSERAGYLGDVDVNHPSEWTWPRAQWTVASGQLQPLGNAAPLVREDTIDIIMHVAKASEETDQEILSVFGSQHPLFDAVQELAVIAAQHDVALTVVDALQQKFEPLGNGKFATVGHSGFADGISQPDYSGVSEYKVPNVAQRNKLEDDRNPLGDLLLGHSAKPEVMFTKQPSDGSAAQRPHLSYDGSSLKDGTFQVIRKINFDRAAFDSVEGMLSNGSPNPGKAAIQAHMIGRDPQGRPLGGGVPGEQNFNYLEGPKNAPNLHDEKTPRQSHVRRLNPRKADTPRILRRGFSYGPLGQSGGKDQGSMFIAYNANISEQFEVLQRWISGGNSTGLSSGHGDPILAPNRVDENPTFQFAHGGNVVSLDLPKEPIAKLQWGLYAFTPSKEGMESLARGGEAGVDEMPHQTHDFVPRMTELDKTASFETWKLLIEDTDDERRADRKAVWKAIREDGVVRADGYGVLVGGADEVRQVLINTDHAFSVRNYHDRMAKSIGAQYLGYDDPPVQTASRVPADVKLDKRYHEGVSAGDHAVGRAEVDVFFQGFTPKMLFDQAFAMAKDVLGNLPDDQALFPTGDPKNPARKPIGRRVLAEPFFYDVVARLCQNWFGLAGNGIQFGGHQTKGPHCPIDLVNGSFYVFWPQPTDHHVSESQSRTTDLVTAVKQFVAAGTAPKNGTLMSTLKINHPHANADQNDRIAEAVAGACFGFAGPTSGSFRTVLFDWIDTGFLWRAKQRMFEKGGFGFEQSENVLAPEIIVSMAKRSAPDLLHRVAVKDVKVGGVDVKAGDRVVISLGSAAAEEPHHSKWFLFGGGPGGKSAGEPIHACQGMQMGMQVIAGTLAAIMEAGDMTPESPQSIRVVQPSDEPIST